MSMIINGKKSLLNVNLTLVEGGGGEYEAVANGIVERTIEQVELPNATSIGSYAFSNCNELTSVSIPNATSIGTYAFSKCAKLTSVSIPNATSIGTSAFYNCYVLTSVSFPNATSVGGSAFSECYGLTSVSIPNATSIGSSAFYYCYVLTSVSFPNATSIGSSAFSSCTKLTTITLGANRVCTIASTSSIPAKSNQHMTIKVPSNLIESYKVATNWSTHYNNGYITFEPIE